MSCPHCAELKEQVRELTVALSAYETNPATIWEMPGLPDLKLSLADRNILSVLYRRQGVWINADALLDCRGSGPRYKDAHAENLARTYVCRIRKALHGRGWAIANRHGFGYRLEKTDGTQEENARSPDELGVRAK